MSNPREATRQISPYTFQKHENYYLRGTKGELRSSNKIVKFHRAETFEEVTREKRRVRAVGDFGISARSKK